MATEPADLARLERYLPLVAQIYLKRPAAGMIFDRLEREIEIARAAQDRDPVKQARAMRIAVKG